MKTISLQKSIYIMIITMMPIGMLIPMTSNAATYYISSTGNDSLSGTSLTEAWQTIDKVNTMEFKPGDKILFEANRLFKGQIFLDSSDGNDSIEVITFSSYGNGRAVISSNNDYGFYAYNTQGIKISNLIFTGSGMDLNTTDGITIFTDLAGNRKLRNIFIENTEVMNYGERGISISSWNGTTGFKNVSIDNVHVHHTRRTGIELFGFYSHIQVGWAHENVTITNSEVHDITGYSSSVHKGSGIVMAQVNSGLIENCIAHDNGFKNDACGGPGGIWAWDCNAIIIQYCESYNNHTLGKCDGLGFDLDGGAQNSIMQYNYSHDNDGAGFLAGQFAYARDWFNNIIRYNISVNDGRRNSGSISLFKAPETTMKNVQIYNNTVIVSGTPENSALAAFNFIPWENGIDSIEVYNNIFQTSGTVPLVDVPAGYNAFFAGNLYWSTDNTFLIKYQDSVYHDLQSWQNSTGNEMLNNVHTGIYSDPKFIKDDENSVIDYEEDKFKLSPGSPAINAGVDIQPLLTYAAEHDFWKNPTPQEGRYDVGAFESLMKETNDPDTIDNSGLTGIDTYHSTLESKVRIYPNPATINRTVQIETDIELKSVEMFTLEGSLVWSEFTESSNTENIQVQLDNVSAGIYIIRTTDSHNRLFNHRLVIN